MIIGVATCVFLQQSPKWGRCNQAKQFTIKTTTHHINPLNRPLQDNTVNILHTIRKYGGGVILGLFLGLLPSYWVSTALVGIVGYAVCDQVALQGQERECDDAVEDTRNQFNLFFWLVFAALIAGYTIKTSDE